MKDFSPYLIFFIVILITIIHNFSEKLGINQWYLSIAINDYFSSIKKHIWKYIFFSFALLLIYSADYLPIQLWGLDRDRVNFLNHPDYLYTENDTFFSDKMWTKKDSIINDPNWEIWKSIKEKLEIKKNPKLKVTGDIISITVMQGDTTNTTKPLIIFRKIAKSQQIAYKYPHKKDNESAIIFALLTWLIGIIVGLIMQIIYRTLILYDKQNRRKKRETPVFLLYGFFILIFGLIGSECFHYISTPEPNQHSIIANFFKISLNNVYGKTNGVWVLIIIQMVLFTYISLRLLDLRKLGESKERKSWKEIFSIVDVIAYTAVCIFFFIVILVIYIIGVDWVIDLEGVRQFPECLQIIIFLFAIDTIIQKDDEIKKSSREESFALHEMANIHLIDNAIDNATTLITPIQKGMDITEESRESAIRWLEELKIFMDFMLKRYRDDELFVTLASEIQFLRRFIVFQIAGDEKLVVRFNGERINGKVEEIALNSIDKKEWEKVKIPRLCLIEGVVNSIKYVDTTNKPTIEITCSLCEEKLDFVVINKVNSKNKEVKKKSSGSGLELTKNILSSAYIPSNFIAPDPLEILKGNNFIYRVIIEDVFDETKRINYHPKTEEK